MMLFMEPLGLVIIVSGMLGEVAMMSRMLAIAMLVKQVMMMVVVINS